MQPLSSQQLRVFLSSTFIDMQEERDALVKLFRELSGEGKKRGVDIKLVDLRWGVTDDQRRTGRVISTCLQEIDDSRPFFIGIVGDRYGWIPSKAEIENNPEIREKFPIVLKYVDKGLSITEIEMRYGVLDAPTTQDALFLLKKGMRFENERHLILSDELTSGKVSFRFYDSPRDIVNHTKEAIFDILNRNYPLLADVPEWEQFEKTNENVAKANRTGYIAYGNYLERLDNWLRSDSQFLVVTGESGCGKSALISEWVARGDFSGYKVMYHFIGSDLAEGSFLDVQRHFLTRLEYEYGLEPTPLIEMTDGDDDYSLELENALKEADKHGDKWLLIVEGLDHLENVASTKMMFWFPEEIPPSTKVLFSTIPDDLTYLRLCDARGYEQLPITPLNKEFIKVIVTDYLANVGKSIDPALTDMIASNEIFSNPNLLRLLLDELVTFGIHEQMGAIVFNFTTSEDKKDFYIKLIKHAEDYYGKSMIKDLFSLLFTTKSGLTDTAITEILRWDPLDWSMIHAGVFRLLVFVNGKYVIANPDIHEALSDYYEYEENDYELMDHWARRTLEYLEEEQEDIEEIAFLNYRINNDEKLYNILIDPANAMRLMMKGDKLFASYWTSVLENTDHSLYDYLDVEFTDLPDWDAEDQLDLLSYIISVHFPDGELSIKLMEKTNEIYLAKGEDDKSMQSMVATNYVSIAQTLLDMGDIEEGMEKLLAAEEINKKIGEENDSFLLLIKSNFATKYGEYEKALDLILQAIEMEKASGEEIPWKYLNNAGLCYFNLGQNKEALKMFELALEGIKKDMIVETLEGAMVLQNTGLALAKEENYDKAEEYYNKALEIYEINLENPGSQVALLLNNLGTIYQSRDQLDECMEYFTKACEIMDNVAEDGETPEHAMIYANIALTWEKKEDIQNAIEWYEKSVATYWNVVGLSHNEFEQTFMHLVDLYDENKQFQEELDLITSLIERAEEEEESGTVVCAFSHLRLGEFHDAWEEYDEAREHYQTARDIFLMLGDQDGVQAATDALSSLPS